MTKQQSPSERRPAKARGTIAVPRMSPKRVLTPWYRRGPSIAAMVVILLGLLGLGVKVFQDIQSRSKSQKQERQTVQLFQRGLQILQSPMQDVFTSINTAPDDFKAGKLSPEDFKRETLTWLEAFRRLDAGIRSRQIPSGQRALEESKVLLLQGAVVYIDAVKMFGLAASQATPELRDQVIDQARATFAHATDVFGMGQRQLAGEMRRLGLERKDPTKPNPLLDQPLKLPSETPPPPPPDAPPGSSGGVIPGQGQAP
ncbi:MAG TPA: hypothetical protein VI541_02855 [Actinomycetota bacterium]|nr:hypothetical protein [Actinomycetota bacterium]